MFHVRDAKLLQAGAHLAIDGCPGLRLEASQSTKAWTYRYRSPVNGKLKQVKLGLWPAMSIAQAIAAWEEARGVRDSGVDPGAANKDKRVAKKAATKAEKTVEGYTVRKLVDAYLDEHIDVARKQKGAVEVRRMFDTMLSSIEDVAAADLSRQQAFALLQSHKDIPVQAAKLRAELGAAWTHALDAGRLPDTTPNHWRTIMRGKLKSKGKTVKGEVIGTSKRVLKAAEVAELIRWLPNFSRIVCDILTLYLWTGARGGEIVAMEAHEITDEADGIWWTVPKEKTKNSRHEDAGDLRVPLVGRAADIVRRLLAVNPKGYLFKSRSSRAKVGHVQQKVIGVAVWYHMPYSTTRPEVVRPRLPVTHWAPHDLRRTTRTMLTSLGCPRDVAEAVIGHMQPGIEGVYNLHAYDNERRDWLTKIAAYYEGLAGHPEGASLKLAVTRTTPQPHGQANRPGDRLTRVV